MKKAISILLALCLALTLAACDVSGGGGGGKNKDKDKDEKDPAPLPDAAGSPADGSPGGPADDLPGGETADSARADSNLESTMGQFLHAEGCTYYISGRTLYTSAELDDGSWRDVYDVEYAIYRMGDDKSAEPEELLRANSLLAGLTLCDGKLWFLEVTPDEGENALFPKYGFYRDDCHWSAKMRCVTPNGQDAGGFPVGQLDHNHFSILGGGDGALYLRDPGNKESATESTLICDLRRGVCEEYDPGLPEGTFHMALTFGEGYYYCIKSKQGGMELDNGIWRVPLSGGEPELVTRLDEDMLEDLVYGLVIPSGGTLYIQPDRHTLYAIDMETGDLLPIVGEDEDARITSVNVTGQGVYYLRDDELWFYDAASGEASRLLEDENPDWEKGMLAICGDWIFYMEYDTSPGYYRIPKAAKVFAGGPFFESH